MNAKAVVKSGGGQNRIVYFDILRAIAPIFVVFIHAAVTFGGQTTKIHLVQEFGRWAVPIFFMISGALLLNPKKEFNIKSFYLKNIKRLIIVLLVWSVLYALLFTFFDGSIGSRAYMMGLYLFGGKAYHMWFMFSLLAVYIMVPIIRSICKDRKLLGYAIWIGAIVCFGLPFIDMILQIIASYTNDSFLLGYLAGGPLFTKISSELSLFSLIYYFMLGYFLATEVFSKKMRWMIYFLGTIGCLVDFCWVIVGERIVGIPITANYYFLPVLCMSSAIFLASRYLFAKIKKVPRIIGFMAKHSFGVYLSHLAILIFVIAEWKITSNIPLMIIIGTIATYLISLVLSWALSMIPILKKAV